MNKILAIILLFGTSLVSVNAQAQNCSIVKAAHCFCEALVPGITAKMTQVGCWNQTTQNSECAKSCNNICTNKGTFHDDIKAKLIAKGTVNNKIVCGNVPVGIAGHTGTRDPVPGGLCMVATGGTMMPEVPAVPAGNWTCPSGFSLPDDYRPGAVVTKGGGLQCYQQAKAGVSCPSGSTPAADGTCDASASCSDIIANLTANNGTLKAPLFLKGGAAFKKLASTGGCPSGFTLVPANKLIPASCRKYVAAIPPAFGGTPAKPAYCKR